MVNQAKKSITNVHSCKKCKIAFKTRKGQKMHFNTVHNGAQNNKRAQKRKASNKQKLKIVGVNVAGLSSKFASFDKMLSSVKPSIIMAQETKMRVPGKIVTQNTKDYIFFEHLRKDKKVRGGGLAIGILRCLNPCWVS